MCKDVGLPGAQQSGRIRAIVREIPHSYNIPTILLIMSCNLEKFTVTASSTTGDHEQRDGSHPTTSCPRSNSTVHTASSQTNLFELQTEEAAAVDRRDHEGKPQLTLSDQEAMRAGIGGQTPRMEKKETSCQTRLRFGFGASHRRSPVTPHWQRSGEAGY